jgi:hypothetical protein
MKVRLIDIEGGIVVDMSCNRDFRKPLNRCVDKEYLNGVNGVPVG